MSTETESMDLSPATAGIVLATTIAGERAGDDALGDLLMRHYPPGAVMEAGLMIAMHSLGAGLGAVMEAAFGGAEEGEESASERVMGGLHGQALQVLEQAGREEQLRSVALGLEIAREDGVVSDEERVALERLLGHFQLRLEEAEAYADEHMQHAEAPPRGELTVEEASFLFATMVALGEDGQGQPDDREAKTIMSFFDMHVQMGLMAKMPEEKPTDLPEGADPILHCLAPKVMPTLLAASEDEQLRALAIGLRMAEADGEVDEREQAYLARFCDGLGHSLEAARAWGADQLEG